jgi:putative transcriptional regulator
MKRPRRHVAAEIIADLKRVNAALKAGVPLAEKFTVRSVRKVPDPSRYGPADVRRARRLVGVSQPVFAQLLGVSAALVRAWECGQRTPSPLARRLLDQVNANPSAWRSMVEAA